MCVPKQLPHDESLPLEAAPVRRKPIFRVKFHLDSCAGLNSSLMSSPLETDLARPKFWVKYHLDCEVQAQGEILLHSRKTASVKLESKSQLLCKSEPETFPNFFTLQQ